MESNRKAKLRIHILPGKVVKLRRTGRGAVIFSAQIAEKYALCRKSGILPALIFLKSFGKSIVNKSTNICRTELTNNHFRPHLTSYFRTFSLLNQISNHYHQSQKLSYSANYGETQLHPETKILNSYSPDLNNSSANVIARIGATKHSPQPHITLLLKECEGGSFAALRGAKVAKGIIQGDRGLTGSRDIIRRPKPVATDGHNTSTVIRDRKVSPELQILMQIGQHSQNITERSKPPYVSLRGKAGPIPKIGGSSTISKDESPHEVYPERDDELLHYAENDKRRAQGKRLMVFSNQNNSVFLRRITDFFNNMPYYRLSKRSNSLMQKSEIDSPSLVIAKRTTAITENHIVNKSTELILRKPITQNTIISESKDYQDKGEIISPKMTEKVTKTFINKSAHEIAMISDKVYKMIEKRLAIEKDRRGW